MTKELPIIGLTIQAIHGMVKDSKEILFKMSDGRTFRMWHSQDCCEYVRLEDVCGNPDHLIGKPITQADEESNEDNIPGYDYHESHTWTFYRIATNRGQVVLRWLGESNGYYSERVSFEQHGSYVFVRKGEYEGDEYIYWNRNIKHWGPRESASIYWVQDGEVSAPPEAVGKEWTDMMPKAGEED